MSAKGESAKVIVIALVANLGIAAAKFAGAFLSGSASLLAEAVHSLVDCTNQVLLLVGNRRSRKAATKRHPLGFGREAFFWSFLVAVLLFSLGGVFAIYEGLHKLSSPGEVSSPLLGLGILAFSLGLEGISFRACLREIRKQNPHKNLWQWFRRTTSSELLVVFTEDAAALVGLAIAFVGLGLSWFTGNAFWDAGGSILVGALLVVVALLLATEIKSLIVGEAPATDFRTFLDARVAEHLPGGSVLNLIALQTGASEVMLSCKVWPGTVKDVSRLIDAFNAIEREMKAHFPELKWQFLEPDDRD